MEHEEGSENSQDSRIMAREQIDPSLDEQPAQSSELAQGPEIDQRGPESSGNALSNRTTQKLEDASDVTGAEPKPVADDLHKLSQQGYSISPGSLIGRTASSGIAEAGVAALQNSRVRYQGRPAERDSTWHAAKSPACPARHLPAASHRNLGEMFAAQPPASSSAIPPNPFQAEHNAAPELPALRPIRADTIDGGSHESETIQRSLDIFALHSPRPSSSDAGTSRQAVDKNSSLSRQLSLPDMGELNDLWSDLPQNSYELENLVGKDSLLLWNSTQGSLGLKQFPSWSVAKYDRDSVKPLQSLLQDFRAQKRHKSIKPDAPLLLGPIDWKGSPNEAADGEHEVRGRLPSWEVAENSTSQADQGLPDQVELALVTAPSIFGHPTCINRMFKPGFAVKVTVRSAKSLTFPATVTAYALQRDQLAQLEQWAPSKHQIAEVLSGNVAKVLLRCDKPSGPTGAFYSATAELPFPDLRFNHSSRMKPRWLVFCLELPTEDFIYIQYTVPTVVMSRQCDQTPKALAILQGEKPTRKRTRQEMEKPFADQWGQVSPSARRHASYATSSPGLQDQHQYYQQHPVQAAFSHGLESAWPMQEPYDMDNWRTAIQMVCRMSGLTRSFTMEDMHELAKVAGFVGNNDRTKTQALTYADWRRFGSWFMREVWMNGHYKLISGFAITRDRADQLIEGQPEGTFILRPSIALEGTFVISLIREGHPHHLALDAMQLQQRSLMNWISCLGELQYLLDIDTGRRVHKSIAFAGMLADRQPQPQPAPANRQVAQAYAYTPSGTQALQHILGLARREPSMLPFMPGFHPADVARQAFDPRAYGDAQVPNELRNLWYQRQHAANMQMTGHLQGFDQQRFPPQRRQ